MEEQSRNPIKAFRKGKTMLRSYFQAGIFKNPYPDMGKHYLSAVASQDVLLREVLADDERLLHGYRVSRPLPGESEDDLS